MKQPYRYLKYLRLGAAYVALGASACALTSKAQVVDVRYFSPERFERDHSHVTNRTTLGIDPKAQLPVKLGRVTSGPHLRERIAYRDSEYELGYYSELRWTERPEAYVRRALSRQLFEAHGLQPMLGGAGPTLDVEVIAFDDLRLKPGRAARVQFIVTLYENDGVLFEDTVTADHRVPGEKPTIEAVVAAMSAALEAAAEATTLRVQTALDRMRSTMPPD